MSRLVQAAAVLLAAVLFLLLTPAGGVPILAYHQISREPEIYSLDPEQFEEQLQYLHSHGYTAISLAEFFAAGHSVRPLPPKPVIITFDDGYEDNYRTALPLLQKYGLRATVFVIAGQVGQAGYLTWEQIAGLQAAGIEIGSHTYSHAALNELSQDRVLDELRRSKQVLEHNLATPVAFLAYPFGQYNPETAAAARQAGYTGACTGRPGLGTLADDAYQLKRVNIPRPRYGLWEFRLRLLRAHLYGRLAALAP